VYYLYRSETDEKYLVPYATDEGYLSALKKVIEDTKTEFVHAQPDREVFEISKNRSKLDVLTFLPKHETVRLCQNKFSSYERWKCAGIQVPRTILINTPNDLEKSFEILGKPLWIRAIYSPGAGKGSIKAPNFEIAKAWIDFNEGWGNFVAAECLEEQTVTWMSIWKDGELVVAQGRKRLYWELSNRAPSGVTGLTGTGVTISDSVVDEIAQRAIFAIDRNPNGIFSVDMTYDKEGVPNPTEINIGRFFTTHYFFTKAGLNMPYIYVKLAYNEKIPNIKKKINPLKPGLCWIRGIDFLPILTDLKHIKLLEKKFRKDQK
jgi:carbamoyl-phosphate synthase large subunit